MILGEPLFVEAISIKNLCMLFLSDFSVGLIWLKWTPISPHTITLILSVMKAPSVNFFDV